jgi:uncharacterized protein YecE (DUF72 family)
MPATRLFVGTSGYAYRAWKGKFYPLKLPQREMLAYYAEHFSAVEINNSFYKLPAHGVIASWADQTPKSFRLVLKAPQTVTHFKRLRNCEEATKAYLQVASTLKLRRGPLFFQLPGTFKKDVPRLAELLKMLGKQSRTAFEFRHESWLDDDVYECLRKYSCALCYSDDEATPAMKFVRTADWGYIRLRREAYSDRQLRSWVKKIRSAELREAYVFFKHEDTGTGPKLAARFIKLAETKTKGGLSLGS